MSKASILIVEDEHIVALDLQNNLERNGYEVVGRADRGEVAIKKAEALHPDLVLMDIGLKGEMDGIEAAIHIRTHFNLPIIFLTAFANQSIIERALLAESYGYILKPFVERELIITIEMALYKHGMERKLRENENKFRSVIERASDGIALLDPLGNFIEWNPAMEQITGLKSSDVIGQPVWEITFQMLPKEQKTANIKEMAKVEWEAAIKSGFAAGEKMMEREIETPQGIRRTIQSNGFSLETSQGLLGGVIMRDVTTGKALETSEHEHRQLAEALRDTALALNSSLKLDEILDRILENIGKLVKYDVAMVFLIEGDAIRKIRYHSNFQNPSSQPPVHDVQANLINAPILQEIIKTRQPYLISDNQKDSRWQAVTISETQRIRSLAYVPIEKHGKVEGVITVISATPDFFTPLHIERIVTFASQAAVAFENARLFERTQYLSLTDPLTELYNMRYLNNFGGLEFERAQRYVRPLSVAMMDIDHFKRINDAHGHGVGDLVLCEIVARIKKAVRTVDITARYGGEEFVILMPETGLEDAYQVAERVRQSVADNPIEIKAAVIPVTLSLGVAEMDQDVKNLEQLIEHADRAMYAAKAAGRNRVERYV